MKQKKFKIQALLIGLVLVLALTGCSQTNNEEPDEKIKLKIGILPIEDSLPLVVANEKGYFAEENLDVELITFQSAVESQSAIQSGQIDGMVTDIIVTALLKDSGLDAKITNVVGSSEKRRRFAILASANSGIETVEDLKGKSIGISNNSIIEYVTDKLLDDAGLTEKSVKKTSIPKIPVRLEMLNNNQIDVVNIPEPLVTFAELHGAKVILDDSEHYEVSEAILLMTEEALGKDIEGLYSAYNKAVKEINANPNDFKEIFVNNINIPEPIIENYQVPTYPELRLPAEKDVNDVLEWLNTKELLKKPLKYDDLIKTGLY